MKWIDCKEKLPPTHRRVLVCREIRLSCLEHPVLTHDIGMLQDTDSSYRWKLESQQYSPLPISPTLSSRIVTHWANLPELPER